MDNLKEAISTLHDLHGTTDVGESVQQMKKVIRLLDKKPVLDETLSFLVHGPSKVGKSTLGATCPAPRLILDAEGGTKFLAGKKVKWNPATSPPPEVDGSWESCIVTIRKWPDMEAPYELLNSGNHRFASVVIDSITEVQRRCKNNLVGNADMQRADWGKLLTRMEGLIRAYRDLTEHPTNPIQVAMFIAETRMEDGKWRAYVQGGLSTSLPYLVDVAGYLEVVQIADPADATKSKKIRRLLVSPYPQVDAGERVQGRLGEFVDNPNVEQMLRMVYPNNNDEGETDE